MTPGTNRNRPEWLFVVTMVGVCGTLAVLQYRWTGDVARAEITLMRESLSQQARQLCTAFDAELLKSRAILVPTAAELDKSTPQEVHRERLRKWKQSKPAPIFKRMAVVARSGDDFELLAMNVESTSLVPMDWPEEWSELRKNLFDKRFGRPSPHENDVGRIRAFPVMEERQPGSRNSPRSFGQSIGRSFGSSGWGGWGEREWVILELDADYLRKTWMPELVTNYLNPKGNVLYDVRIRSKQSPEEVIFSSGPASSVNGAKPFSIEFNYFGSDPQRFRFGPSAARWTMEVGYRAGSLETVVARSRQRNLAVALALNTLVLGSGWMLLRATRRSRRLAEEQMRFVANVTHELRTPLTVIRGAAHNLKRGIVKDPGGIEKYSGLIIEHAEALGAMVEQVLNFSGDRHGETIRESVDLGQVLRDAALTVKSDARFSACKIDIHLPADIPSVTGDPAALRRVFQNLLENAAKHGGGGGLIGITAAMRDRWVEIRVEDCGPGIPDSEIDEIFTPFFRGAHARANQVRGSGLGLSLVKEIVEAHGGGVSVHSEIGKGCTFTITLPA